MADAITGPAVAFNGFATGLDTQSIINALIGVRRQRATRLEAQRTKIQKQQTAFGQLRTKLTALRTKADAINSVAKLGASTVATTDDTLVTATASGGAATGTYTVDVTQLAKTQTSGSTGYADKDATVVGDGKITFVSGGVNHEVTIAAGSTLEDIRDAINASAAPVSATVIDDGSGATPFKLVITADEQGAAGAFTADLSAFTPAGAALSFAELSPAQNATFTVNGLPVSRASNSVTDLVEGVTFNLKAAGAATITVEHDPEEVKKRIKEFVGAYNDVADEIRAHQKFADREGKAILFGEASLTRVLSKVRGAATSAVTGLSGASDSLADLGIRTDQNGRLVVDDESLDEALEADYAGVLALFTTVGTGSATGLARSIASEITAAISTVISPRTAALGERSVGLGREIAALEIRLEKYAEGLRNKYAALETYVGRFQQQGASLSALG
jgi:flagellar hook-associated protein 2